MDLNDMLKYGNIGVVLISLIMIAVSGLFFGFMYWGLEEIQEGFQAQDCAISGNGLWSTCQEMWETALYPFLEMREIFVWLSYFFIFTLVIAMLLLGYQAGFKPVMLGVLAMFELLLTYGSLYVANIFRVFIANETIRGMLVNFGPYTKIMMNFPWFVFIVSLFSVALGIVNWQRTRTNTPTGELDY
jgi:hypothetical protein